MSADGAGTKRTHTEPYDEHDPDYLNELLEEQENLNLSQPPLPHSLRLITEEIERIRSGNSAEKKMKIIGPESKPNGGLALPWNKPDDGTGIKAILQPDQTSSSGIKSIMKIFVPMLSIDARKGSSRGLLLGSGGNTLRTIQNESKCRLTIKGKGSSKNSQEAPPGTETEEEELHVLVEYDGSASGRDTAFIYVENMVRTVLSGGSVTPMSGPPAHIFNPYYPGYGHAGYPSYGGMPAPAPAGSGMQEAEQAYINAEVAAGRIVTILASHRDTGTNCKTSIKVYVPARTAVGDSRGKILGTKGSSLRQIQADSGCRLSLRGKGSCKIPDGENEDSLAAANPSTYGHLKEGLHVQVDYEGPVHLKDHSLQSAESLIRATLTPATDAAAGGFPQTQFELMMQHKQHYTTAPPAAPASAGGYPPPYDYSQYRPGPAPAAAPAPAWGAAYPPAGYAGYPSYY